MDKWINRNFSHPDPRPPRSQTILTPLPQPTHTRFLSPNVGLLCVNSLMVGSSPLDLGHLPFFVVDTTRPPSSRIATITLALRCRPILGFSLVLLRLFCIRRSL